MPTPPLTHAGRHPAALVAVGVAMTMVTATACTGSPQPPAPAAERALVVGLPLEPASLDFTRSEGAAIPQVLLTNVYEGLVKVGQDGTIQPGLASSWTLSPDRRTYTFTLAEGAKFSNGRPFTADDAAFSINRVKTGWKSSTAQGMSLVTSAKATAPQQLEVSLRRPSNDWLYRMTTRMGVMFPKDFSEKLATTTVGTGPYQVAAWQRGDSLTLKRNDSYAGTRPFFDKVTFKYIKDPAALNKALLGGAVNVIGSLQAPDSLGQFSSDGRYQVVEGTSSAEVMLALNNAKSPFIDPRARRAVRKAIDHKALLNSCWGGRGQLIGSMASPLDPWYEDVTGLIPYDPRRAKALIKSIAPNGLPVRLRVPALPYATSCGKVVKSMLDRVGFKVTVQELSFPAWLSGVFQKSDYEMSIVAHTEPRDLAAIFGSPNGYTRYRHPALTAALNAADEGSPDQQRAQMRAAARILAQDTASDWLFLLPNLMVADRNITGLPKNVVSESFDVTTLARS